MDTESSQESCRAFQKQQPNQSMTCHELSLERLKSEVRTPASSSLATALAFSQHPHCHTGDLLPWCAPLTDTIPVEVEAHLQNGCRRLWSRNEITGSQQDHNRITRMFRLLPLWPLCLPQMIVGIHAGSTAWAWAFPIVASSSAPSKIVTSSGWSELICETGETVKPHPTDSVPGHWRDTEAAALAWCAKSRQEPAQLKAAEWNMSIQAAKGRSCLTNDFFLEKLCSQGLKDYWRPFEDRWRPYPREIKHCSKSVTAS